MEEESNDDLWPKGSPPPQLRIQVQNARGIWNGILGHVWNSYGKFLELFNFFLFSFLITANPGVLMTVL